MFLQGWLRSLLLLALVMTGACSPAAPLQSGPSLSEAAAPVSSPVHPPVASPVGQPVLVRPALPPEALPAPAPTPFPTRAEPQITAPSALLIDAVTGRVIFEKNASERRAVASTQKLLTALVVYRDAPLSDLVQVKASDTQVVPSKLYLKAGETYTRADLIKALIVKSGNDVAKALARDVSGSQDAFVALMNQTALEIGMRNSHFKNPHGLTAEGQYSTAHDLGTLARAILQIPYYRQCMQTKEYLFQYPGGRTRKIENTNEVLDLLPYCTGMKTGTTRASGKCLVSSGRLGNRSVIAVILGSSEPKVWQESVALLRYGLER